MQKSLSAVYAIAVLFLLTSTMLSAAAVHASCPGGSITNVVSDPGDSYTCDGLIFSNFSVSQTGAVLGIGNTSGVVGNEVELDWSVSNAASPGDIVLIYEVAGPSTGVDLSFIGTATGLPGPNQNSVVITETVCTVGISNGGCAAGGKLEANFGGTSSATVNPNGFSQSVSFADGPQVIVWIKKDIQFNGSFALTDFENSNLLLSSPVPEPMTFSLIGSALVGLGLLRRKRNTLT